MKYQINKDNYHRFDVFQVNKLPPRAYFIPFADEGEADRADLLHKRSQSSKVRCLNGAWDFKFYPRPAQLPDVLDTEELGFDTLDVPSCWQFRGYDRPFYVNTRYQFPFNPPEIPKEDKVGKTFSWVGADKGVLPRWQTPKEEYNFAGVYRRRLTLEKGEKRYILSFLGVASCVDVYLNGKHIGYSEGSHNTAEFDITRELVDGENELLCVVRRWCTGTYLECQDMFRNNGIFRDVLLYELEEGDLWDVTFSAEKGEKGYRAYASCATYGSSQVEATLTGPNVEETKKLKIIQGGTFFFEDIDPVEWTAENPVLYDLKIKTPHSCVKLRVGFKRTAIREDVFTLNGRKLKLRGVNHHDTSATNGYYLTPEEIQRDVLLCKEHNIDTVRTSHYPPDPLLLELCDELGIYVVDEADIETHGTFSQQLPPTYNTISHDIRWRDRYLERAQRLYGRDKNHISVIMWSLGNESGGYANTDAMYEWLKKQSDLPVHYESAIHCDRIAYDVGSEMYPSVEQVHKVATHSRKEKQLNDRPYFLCEYAHAMGVGPGAIEEYWQEIYNHDNLMGGCVWEMVDHAVLHPDGSYTYGGDHDEWMHDGNFCVDGIFYPDRTPSTGAKIVRHAYRPIRVTHLGENRYEIFNTMAFTDASAYEISFRFSDGRVVTPEISLAPLTRAEFALEGCEAAGEWVTVEVSRAGKCLSREQLIFELAVRQAVQTLPSVPENVELVEGRVSVRKGDKVLTASTPHTILFRAPTDNDVDLTMRNTMEPYTRQKEKVTATRIQGNKLLVESRIACAGQVYRCTDTYEDSEEGILVTSTLKCILGTGKLPRFGKAFRLDADFDRVSYKARNGESYCDMKEQAQVEEIRCSVQDMTEPNLRPQESGNRCDCVWAAVSDGETAFTFEAVGKPYELGIKPYSDRELLKMRHREDEKQTGTYVTLSAFQMGIGTGSCGPMTRPEYTFDANKEYTLRFLIK